MQDQWQCQRSKGARSFRSQKILKPGHQTFFVVALKTQAANTLLLKQSNSQGQWIFQPGHLTWLALV